VNKDVEKPRGMRAQIKNVSVSRTNLSLNNKMLTDRSRQGSWHRMRGSPKTEPLLGLPAIARHSEQGMFWIVKTAEWRRRLDFLLLGGFLFGFLLGSHCYLLARVESERLVLYA